jgi:methyl-accepting chemotaxis protein
MTFTFAGFRRHRAADMRGRIEALNRSQAVIEFSLDGTVLDANDLFLDTFGYSRSEVVGHHHRMFVPSEDVASEEYARFWGRLNTGEPQTALYRRVAKDGRDVWIQGSYNPILDRRGRACKVIKYATDITERRLQVADMEGRLKAIDKAQAVITFDLDGTILDANENFLRVVGYSLDEVVGRHHAMFVPEHERHSAEYLSFWDKLGRGNYDAGLYRRIDRHNRELWIQGTYNPIFDMAGRPFKVVKYAVDVSNQTVATRTLHASLADLADTVPAIAERARLTNELALQASQSASDGSGMVDNVVSMMAGIEEGARNIADIVGMIDSLAFQTNILAINATIEAARSGEHGRGFAVVAQEVRLLSQRSAQSAREIRTLIEDTVARVREGSERSTQAGDAMRAIVTSASAVRERVDGIARATTAQANGIDHVRRVVSQLA